MTKNKCYIKKTIFFEEDVYEKKLSSIRRLGCIYSCGVR